MTDSIITTGTHGTMYAGHDAVHLYRAAVLRSSLKLLQQGIHPTRGMTMTKALKLVTEYTGKTYKRTESNKAINDLTLYRAAVLRSSLKLLQQGIHPTRDMTMTKALKLVTEYTGKTYKRTESNKAINDLTVWIETMKSAVPVEHKD